MLHLDIFVVLMLFEAYHCISQICCYQQVNTIRVISLDGYINFIFLKNHLYIAFGEI
jgi:hypothetical protein